MTKRATVFAIAGGLVLAGLALYLIAVVLPQRAPAGAAGPDKAAQAQPADAYATWGLEPGPAAEAAPVTTPENAPLEHLPLDAAFLDALEMPADGRLIGTILVMEDDRLRISADLVQVVDRTPEPPVVRVLPSGTVITAWIADVGAAGPERSVLSEGDVISATILLDPRGAAPAGRVVIQACERISQAGSASGR